MRERRGVPRVTGLAGATAFVAGLVAAMGSVLFAPFTWVMVSVFGVVVLTISSTARLGFFVVGGMLVLQGSDDLGYIKLIYLCGVLFSIVCSWLNGQIDLIYRGSPLRPLLLAALVASLYVTCSAVWALGAGATPQSWLRDAAPYLSVAAVAPIAIDGGRSPVMRRLAVPLFILIGVLSGLSFAIEWLDRRALADLALDRLLLPTAIPAAGLFFFAVSAALYSQRVRARWIALIGFLTFTMAITGTRSALVWLVPPVFVAFLSRGRSRATPRLVLSACLGVVFVWLAFGVVGSQLDEVRFASRVRSVGAFFTDPNSDYSYLERRAQLSAAWESFTHSPLVGTGPGNNIEWSTPWRAASSFNVDTGISLLSKLGIIGGVIFAWLMVEFMRSCLSASGSDTVLKSFVWMSFVYLLIVTPFFNPFEDKGSAYLLVLMASVCYSYGSIDAKLGALLPHARVHPHPIVQSGTLPGRLPDVSR